MKLKDMEIPLNRISGVGPSFAKAFARVNVFTVSDLLSYYPREWEDRTQRRSFAEFMRGKVHTAAQVLSHEWFGFGRMKTLKIIVTDGTERAALVCFNRPFLQKNLPEGSLISVSGAFTYRYGEIQSSSFDAVRIAEEGSLADVANSILPDSAVYPVYALTAGLTQAHIRKTMKKALSEYGKGIEDEIPQRLIEAYGFFHKQKAVQAIHFPANMEEAEQAKRSIIFEELYVFQKNIAERATERKSGMSAPLPKAVGSQKELEPLLSPRQKELLGRLTFSLTKDQIQAIADINADIDAGFAASDASGGKPPFYMARLLQGDVGSGKTLVSFFAALRTIDWGAQCALLAPTEILAKQHAENAARLLEPLTGGTGKGVRAAFLSGNVKNKNRIPLLEELQNGGIDIVIGTHALFSKNVLYRNLKLVIIDEQHRFGVVQRGTIIDKGRSSIVNARQTNPDAVPQNPALLMMSATPIPQTLAHTVYGDLDVSLIKSMPAGRKPVLTHLTKPGNEGRVYETVREELKKGHQAYFVYPRIEDENADDDDADAQTKTMPNTENEKLSASAARDKTRGIKSAEHMYAFLSERVYPEFKCALIHSKTDEEDQSRILRFFYEGRIQVLVATSVVEVGVDVPNATCMVIEQAERFGLAALHQLRGRVGRGNAQSACFLVYGDKLSETGKKRLKVMHESTDGFFIAEEDLRLRGPGEAAGIQQSGYLTLGLADPARDTELLLLARKEALKEAANTPCPDCTPR